MSKPKPYWVYVVQCADNTFYTGIALDLDSRIIEHNKGKASKYTRCRIPVKLVYSEIQTDKSAALKRELQIKKQSRQVKIALINNYKQSDPC